MAKKEHRPNCGGWPLDGVHAASVRVSFHMTQSPTPKAEACDCPQGRTAARNYGTGSITGRAGSATSTRWVKRAL
jgi:hypothetical protein